MLHFSLNKWIDRCLDKRFESQVSVDDSELLFVVQKYKHGVLGVFLEEGFESDELSVLIVLYGLVEECHEIYSLVALLRLLWLSFLFSLSLPSFLLLFLWKLDLWILCYILELLELLFVTLVVIEVNEVLKKAILLRCKIRWLHRALGFLHLLLDLFPVLDFL